MFCTGGSVSEMSATEMEASQALILDVNHAQTMLSKALEEQQEAEQLLWEARRFQKQQAASLKKNVTVTDVLQIQLERLREEKKSLNSNTSQLRKRLFHSRRPSSLTGTSGYVCFFHLILVEQKLAANAACLGGTCTTRPATSSPNQNPWQKRPGKTAGSTVNNKGPLS